MNNGNVYIYTHIHIHGQLCASGCSVCTACCVIVVSCFFHLFGTQVEQVAHSGGKQWPGQFASRHLFLVIGHFLSLGTWTTIIAMSLFLAFSLISISSPFSSLDHLSDIFKYSETENRLIKFIRHQFLSTIYHASSKSAS